MGIVWETYYQGLPVIGVPENLTDRLRMEISN